MEIDFGINGFRDFFGKVSNFGKYGKFLIFLKIWENPKFWKSWKFRNSGKLWEFTNCFNLPCRHIRPPSKLSQPTRPGSHGSVSKQDPVHTVRFPSTTRFTWFGLRTWFRTVQLWNESGSRFPNRFVSFLLYLLCCDYIQMYMVAHLRLKCTAAKLLCSIGFSIWPVLASRHYIYLGS